MKSKSYLIQTKQIEFDETATEYKAKLSYGKYNTSVAVKRVGDAWYDSHRYKKVVTVTEDGRPNIRFEGKEPIPLDNIEIYELYLALRVLYKDVTKVKLLQLNV